MKQFLALPYYEEVWKDIKDYEGLYQVSNFGRVKSLDHYVNGRHGLILRKGKILKQFLTIHGYYQVCLSKDGSDKWYRIHRLVAEAFIPNPHNHPTVDHINRNRIDNRVENLRWAPWILQAKNSSAKDVNANRLSKPVEQYTLDMAFVAEYPSTKEAGKQTGINKGNITSCCLGNRKSAGGYIWNYKN